MKETEESKNGSGTFGPIRLSVQQGIQGALFSRIAWEHGLFHSRSEQWETEARWEPQPAILREGGFHMGTQVIGWVSGALVYVNYGRGATVSVTVDGTSKEHVEAVLAGIRSNLPVRDVPVNQIIPVTFWTHGRNGASEVSRNLEVPCWAEMRDNYSEHTRERLEEMMALRTPASGRLFLWHGIPGTGKTYALRALAWEWREWVNIHYLVEPESFFGENPHDLMEIAMPDDDDDYAYYDEDRNPLLPRNPRRTEAKKKWRLLVLEDAGEMLTKDAKVNVGQALSRLLNLVDGLIGQGLRIMILVTTNEPLGSLHPAIARPGRTGMEINFEGLSAEHANEWLRAQGSNIVVNREKTLAELYGILVNWHGREASRPVGFTPLGVVRE